MLSFSRRITLIAFTLLSGGCASTQLNYNTLDIASSIDTLIVQQVVQNIVKTYINEYAIPSQISVVSGNIQTTNAINPSVSFPFSSNVTSTFGNGLAAQNNLGSIVNNLNAPSATIGSNNSWQQSYVVLPLTDADTLRRLNYLYRYAAGHITAGELLCNYPVPVKISSNASVQVDISTGTEHGPTKQNVQIDYIESMPKGTQCVFNEHGGKDEQGQFHKTWPNIALKNPDIAFMLQPGCVVCDTGPYVKTEEGDRGYFTRGEQKFTLWRTPQTCDPETKKCVPLKMRELQLNDKLSPTCDEGKNGCSGLIDWLKVMPAGEPIPMGFEVAGQSDNYILIVESAGNHPGQERFANLVYSILDATLQANYNGKGTSLKGITPTLNVGRGGG